MMLYRVTTVGRNSLPPHQGFLHTSVYRKPTHTNQLLHFDSHHPLHQKIGVVKTLTRRAMNVSSDNDSTDDEHPARSGGGQHSRSDS